MALHVPAAPCRQPLAQTHNPYLFHALADASSRAQFPGTSCGPLRAPSCLSKTFFQPRASNGVYERHGTYEERLHTTRTSAAPLQPFTYIQGQAFWWPSTPLTAAGRPACPAATHESDNDGNNAAGEHRGRKRSRAARADLPLPPPSALRSSPPPPASDALHTNTRTDAPNAPHPALPYTPASRVTGPAAAPSPPRKADAAPPPAHRRPFSAGGIAPRA